MSNIIIRTFNAETIFNAFFTVLAVFVSFYTLLVYQYIPFLALLTLVALIAFYAFIVILNTKRLILLNSGKNILFFLTHIFCKDIPLRALHALIDFILPTLYTIFYGSDTFLLAFFFSLRVDLKAKVFTFLTLGKVLYTLTLLKDFMDRTLSAKIIF